MTEKKFFRYLRQTVLIGGEELFCLAPGNLQSRLALLPNLLHKKLLTDLVPVFTLDATDGFAVHLLHPGFGAHLPDKVLHLLVERPRYFVVRHLDAVDQRLGEDELFCDHAIQDLRTQAGSLCVELVLHGDKRNAVVQLGFCDDLLVDDGNDAVQDLRVLRKSDGTEQEKQKCC